MRGFGSLAFCSRQAVRKKYRMQTSYCSPTVVYPSMECPVCDRIFPLASINTHVNECLGSTSNQDLLSKEADDRNTNISEVPTKRQKTSNWGSLQPMRSSRPSEAASVSPSAAKKSKKTFDATKESRTASSSAEGQSETGNRLLSDDGKDGRAVMIA